MAGDMIERAAKAIATVTIPAFADERIWAEDLPHYRARDERAGGKPKMENVIGIARSALLAALDPEDEALVTAVGDALRAYEGSPRAAIAAIKKMAQGERSAD